MAVFTEVSEAQAGDLVRKLGLGELRELRGIHGGIENTNYFLTTELDGARHEYVLTLFERLTAGQLPFYLHLMKHLAQRGIPVPDPHGLPDSTSSAHPDGQLLHQLCGKPAAVVDKLRGHSVLDPQPSHCAAVGTMLARMHLAGRDYPQVPAQSAGPGMVERDGSAGAAAPGRGAGCPAAQRARVPEPCGRRFDLCRPAPRRGACGPVPRQRDVRGQPADRLLRFLFRRHRHAGCSIWPCA